MVKKISNTCGNLVRLRKRIPHFEQLELRQLLASDLSPILDLNANVVDGDSSPHSFVHGGDKLFFGASTPKTGSEPWVTDGTDAGTQMLGDLRFGEIGSIISPGAVVNGVYYFTARGGDGSTGLWRSDGTVGNTAIIKSFATPQTDHVALFFANVNGTLYFTEFSESGDLGLWTTDGTSSGTRLLKSGLPSDHSTIARMNDTLFFACSDSINGRELWKIDGTTGIAEIVKNIAAGVSSSHPKNLTNVNGTLFFSAVDGPHGNELWKSDGTESGTRLVEDIRLGQMGSVPTQLFNMNGKLVFFANDSIVGSEFWQSDGTEAGTLLTKDIRTGVFGSTGRNYVMVNGVLFFVANDGVHNEELWRSDGTESGTVMIKDIVPLGRTSNIHYLTEMNGKLYFSAMDDAHGQNLWTSDGTEAGTTLVQDFTPTVFGTPRNLINFNGTLFFSANDGVHGYELWASDGSDQGTTMVKNLVVGTSSADPKNLVNIGGSLYFQATDSSYLRTIRKTDGTAQSTIPIFAGSTARYFGQINGKQLFAIFDAAHGEEQWSGDGSIAGTTLLKDIAAGARSSFVNHAVSFGGHIYFIANEGADGDTIWKTDGTTQGTVRVKDLRAGSQSMVNWEAVEVSGTLYFTADDGIHGLELWRSDGTSEGTVLVKDIVPGAIKSWPQQLMNLNGKLIFVANSVGLGNELMISDGTDVGTILIKDINTGNQSSLISGLTRINDQVYFSANDGTNGAELWKTDGTAAGTQLVRSIRSGIEGANPSSLLNMAGTLFFAAMDDSGIPQVWRSDGSSVGTIAITNFDVKTDQTPSHLTDVYGRLYFSATNLATGAELFKSDGTIGSTTLVRNIAGRGGSYPSNLTVAGSNLYFSASTESAGTELHTVAVNRPPQGITLSSNILTENNANPVIVATLSTDDLDPSDRFQYELIDGEGDRDNDLFQVDGDQLSLLETADYERKSFYSIRLGSTDSDGRRVEQVLLIYVNNEIEFVDLLGTNGDDTFIAEFIGNDSNTWRVTRNGQTVYDDTVRGRTTRLRFDGLSGTDTVEVRGTAGDDEFGLFIDRIVVNRFALTGNSIERWTVMGQTGADTFLGGHNAFAEIDGGPGADNVLGVLRFNVWAILGPNSGLLNSIVSFANIESINGGSARDIISVGPFGKLEGNLYGGSGDDKVVFENRGIPLTYSMAGGRGTVSGILGAIYEIEHVESNGVSADVIRGTAKQNYWQILSSGAISVRSVRFDGFERIEGNIGVDSLQGPNADTNWQITSPNAGIASFRGRTIEFSGIENLFGDLAPDDFSIAPTGALSGDLSGGPLAANSLSYRDWTTDVFVDLSIRTPANATGVNGVTSAFSLISGGNANDRITSLPNQSSVLIGNDGNDFLKGSSVNDILIGNLGIDELLGSFGQDILIAGSTTYDRWMNGLRNLQNEWRSSDRTFATRVENINGTGTGARLNGNVFLTDDTIVADASNDALAGNGDRDWFWGMVSELTDFVASTDRRDDE